MKIKLPHVQPPGDPEKNHAWKKVDCVIRDPQGAVFFDLKNAEAPATWSQLAVDIAAAKYFRKKGVPGKGNGGRETSVRQMVRRVTGAIAKTAAKQKYFSPKDAAEFEKALRGLLLDQRGSFNSPVWFNCGLFEAYKIKSPHRSWGWDARKKKTVEYSEAFEHPQVSACFIQSIDDNLESIFQLVKTEALLFKYGSGSGTNFSRLRSRYEELEGGGTSSGLLSFLDVLDRGAGSIKSGGTNRRAAKMVIVDVDHPEVEDFIQWKAKEEKKAEDLIKAGWSGGLDGEAFRSVSGQNGNNSVRVTDAFMRAVKEGRAWQLRNRATGKPTREIPARDLWNLIAKTAWTCADPGLQFHDAINAMNPVAASGEFRASNPCSEFMFLDDTACNLASLNLIKFWSVEEGEFDFAAFVEAARAFFTAQEIFVDYASYPTEKIARQSHDFRPLGLGFAGLGALLMRMNIPYDSTEGRAWGAALTALLTGVAYGVSAEIAAVKGPFPAYAKNKKSMQAVLAKHARAVDDIAWEVLPEELRAGVEASWEQTLALAKKHGVRNAQATLIAPTGTIGLVMDADTTGIEPEYSLLKIKKLVGGGEVQMLSGSLEIGLRKLGYADGDLAKIQEHVMKFSSVRHAPAIREEHKYIFATAQEIPPEAHLGMMAAVQPFLSGAISKTVNLPRAATIDQVAALHFKAWELGLKSVAIYRDGSKGVQPLESLEAKTPDCAECGSPTELAGSCWRCPRCGFVMGCA